MNKSYRLLSFTFLVMLSSAGCTVTGSTGKGSVAPYRHQGVSPESMPHNEPSKSPSSNLPPNVPTDNGKLGSRSHAQPGSSGGVHPSESDEQRLNAERRRSEEQQRHEGLEHSGQAAKAHEQDGATNDAGTPDQDKSAGSLRTKSRVRGATDKDRTERNDGHSGTDKSGSAAPKTDSRSLDKNRGRMNSEPQKGKVRDSGNSRDENYRPAKAVGG